MNTETIKSNLLAELVAIYAAGGSYCLTKQNAAQKRAVKALKGNGMNPSEAQMLIHEAAVEWRKANNQGIRGEIGFYY